ncbi:MAG: cyclopropane-fatty-acyl-phospholipid synthase family protein [Actinomycetota bacterium]
MPSPDVISATGVTTGGAAATLQPIIAALVGDVPALLVFWDGSRIEPAGTKTAGTPTIRVNSADAIRRIMRSPDELGFARAYVAGDLETDGDLIDLVKALRPAGLQLGSLRRMTIAVARALSAARKLELFSAPPAPPAEEARLSGRLHTRSRDAQAISHHYDVGNEFYEIVLGPTMTYSCARFADDSMTLAQAQTGKHELISRKLGLHGRSGLRLLDVGCGWGSMALHAAAHHGAQVVGITISAEQAAYARARVERAGLADLVEIRLQDYRDLAGERFDAISSVGMFEHVGKARMGEYFATLRALLSDNGRLLNHAISSVGGSRIGARSFVGRYVFPDGELLDVGDVVLAMEGAGFEVRDVESLREHYALTLRHWLANLDERWDDAVALVGAGRARVWRLYMAASAIGFEDAGLGLHQVLGVVDDPDGGSAMPRTRDDWAARG